MEKVWTKENFKCDRYCGECCKKTLVDVSSKDITRIKKRGYNENEFLMKYPFNEKRLFLKKDENGWCVFLEKDKDGKYTCKIHKDRPEVCQKYPFFRENEQIKSCLPENLYPNVFFKLPSKKITKSS